MQIVTGSSLTVRQPSFSPTASPRPAESSGPAAPSALAAPSEGAERYVASLPQVEASSTQAQRITRFVEETKQSGARQLRGAMGLMAGQLVGMTVGSMVFAPLAFHYGNLYIATGGAALTGGALALLGHHLASREAPAGGQRSLLADSAVALGGLANSLPSFVYPTVAGATAAEKAIIYEALDRLPLSVVTSAPTIDVVTGLEKAGASGLATPLFSHSRIFLDRDQMALGKDWAQEVTVHEIGHTYDFTKGVGPIGNRSHRGGGFGRAPFVSDYAGTNRMEDYAEAYAHYHRNPAELLESAPKKYETIAASQQPGLVDQAMDRPSVREAGRNVAGAFEKAPWLRNALALGSSMVSPFQLYRGATQVEQALQSRDPQALFDGKMQLAAGSALLFPGTAPLGVALTVGHMVTGKMVAEGALSSEQAQKVADTSLALATGPFGATAASLHRQLERAGLLSDQGGPALFAGGSTSAKASAGEALAGGFALGAVAGGLLSPWLLGGSTVATVSAAAGGTWLGGLAGAALGLAGHAVSQRLSSGPEVAGASASAPGLTREDKVLLGKLATPTVLGGAGGAVLGGLAGDHLGQTLGAAVAGAAGGVTGATVGRYLGMMAGSFTLAAGGARLGSAWAGLQPASA